MCVVVRSLHLWQANVYSLLLPRSRAEYRIQLDLETFCWSEPDVWIVTEVTHFMSCMFSKEGPTSFAYSRNRPGISVRTHLIKH